MPRSKPRSCGNAPDARSAYATAYDALNRNRQFQVEERSTKVALRGNSRGVSSCHVLQRAFGDAYFRRDYVNHATLLLRWGMAVYIFSAKNGERMSRKLIACSVVVLLATMSVFAYTETVDGITWEYQVLDGKAVIGSSTWSSSEPSGGNPTTVPQAVPAVATSTMGAITIPSTIGGCFVVSIGYSAFADCSGLTSVTMPDGITSIGNRAFMNCRGLTSVTIPSGVASIGDYAFSDCRGLTSVTIPNSVTGIGYHAFSGCSSLTNIVVGEGNAYYKSINGLLLSEDGATLILGRNGDVIIPDGVTYIESSAFSGCSGLTSVTIPNSVANIGYSAFYGCSGLTRVTIPSCVCATNLSMCFPDSYMTITNVGIATGVTRLGYEAFANCCALKSVTIPNTVTRIGDRVFYDCGSLMNIDFLGDAPDKVGDEIFSGTQRRLLVSVPEGSIGWDGGFSQELPDTWNGRQIAHAGASGAGFGGGSSTGSNEVSVVQSGDSRYSLSDVVADRVIASVTVEHDCAIDSFVLTEGKVYDSVLRIVNISSSAVTLTLPSGYTYETFDGEMPLVIPACSRNLLSITRIGNRLFLVSRQLLKEIQ